MDEYKKISSFIKSAGYRPTNNTVKACMEIIRAIAIQSKRLGSEELSEINTVVKKERVVGGVIPPDIGIAYQILQQLLQSLCPGVEIVASLFVIYDSLKDKLSKKSNNEATEMINQATVKIIEKLARDNKATKTIVEKSEECKVSIFGKEFLNKQVKKTNSISKSSHKSRSKKK